MKVETRFIDKLRPEYVFSWQVILVTFLGVQLVTAANAYQNTPGHDLERLALSSATTVLLFTTLWIWTFAVVRRVDSDKAPLLMFVGIILATGFRGGYYAWGLVAFGIEPTVDYLSRMLGSVSLFGGVIVATTVTIYEIKTFTQQRSLLVAERLRMEKLKARTQAEELALSTKLLESIKKQLRQSLDFHGSKSVSRTLETLQTTIEDVVRPISQRLGEVEHPDPTSIDLNNDSKIRWGQVFLRSLDGANLRPTAIVLFLAIAIGPSLAWLLGPVEGFKVVAGFVAVTWPILLLLKYLAVHDNPARRKFAALPILLLSSLGANLCFAFDLGIGSKADEVARNAAILFVVIGYLGTFASAAHAMASEVESEIKESSENLAWDLARSRSAIRQRQGALANALHGRVQAGLAAAFINLHAAQSRGIANSTLVSQIQSQSLATLKMLDELSPQCSDIEDVVRSTQTTWQGIATVKFDSSEKDLEKIKLDPLCADSICDLIPELAFNAVKHGHATEIVFGMEWESSRVLVLLARNNGIESQESGRVGLGSVLLSERSLSWVRAATADGTLTRVRLPYQAQK